MIEIVCSSTNDAVAEQQPDAVAAELLAHHLRLRADHPRGAVHQELDRRALAPFGVERVGDVERAPGELVQHRHAQRLRRDRAGVDGDAAEALLALHDGDALAELGGLDGGLLAARARADDEEVEIHGASLTPRSAPGCSCAPRPAGSPVGGPEAGAQRGPAEHPGGVAQLGLRVRGHHRQPQPRACPRPRPAAARRRRRRPARARSSAIRRRQPRRRRSRARRCARRRPRRRSPRARARCAAVGVGLQLLDPARLLAQQLERRHRRGDDGRGRRGRGGQRARVRGQVAGERAVAGARTRRRRRARCRASRRRRRPRARARRRRPRRARPGRRRRAPCDSLDHQRARRGGARARRSPRAARGRRRARTRPRSRSAPRGRRRCAGPRRGARRRRGRRRSVSAPASRQPSATEAWPSAVGEHDLAALGERRDDPEVGEVAGAEQQRGLGAEEARRGAPRAAGAASSCPRPVAARRRRRPSAWRRRPPPRARAGGRPARGGCPSTAAARASRRGPRAGPEARSPSACGDAMPSSSSSASRSSTSSMRLPSVWLREPYARRPDGSGAAPSRGCTTIAEPPPRRVGSATACCRPSAQEADAGRPTADGSGVATELVPDAPPAPRRPGR